MNTWAVHRRDVRDGAQDGRLGTQVKPGLTYDKKAHVATFK